MKMRGCLINTLNANKLQKIE